MWSHLTITTVVEASPSARECDEIVTGSNLSAGVYDIRHPQRDPTPEGYFIDYVNLPYVQNALGVNLNYTESNSDISWAFQVSPRIPAVSEACANEPHSLLETSSTPISLKTSR